MGMPIEQIIKYLPAPICGDTVIGEEKQKEYDAHDSAVIILHKYQKIEQILDIEPVLTLLNNPTNGDMIKALFPNVKFLDNGFTIEWYENGKFITTFDSNNWWNAPYKAESEDKEDDKV